jgi:hypothetical protein
LEEQVKWQRAKAKWQKWERPARVFGRASQRAKGKGQMAKMGKARAGFWKSKSNGKGQMAKGNGQLAKMGNSRAVGHRTLASSPTEGGSCFCHLPFAFCVLIFEVLLPFAFCLLIFEV